MTYGVWIARGSRTPAVLPEVLRTIRFIDRRIANPCYGLLLVTGLGLVYLGQWGFIPWVVASLALWAVMALIALGLYTPTLNKQIRCSTRRGSSPQSAATSRGNP